MCLFFQHGMLRNKQTKWLPQIQAEDRVWKGICQNVSSQWQNYSSVTFFLDYTYFFGVLFYFVLETESHVSQAWPVTCCIAKNGFELLILLCPGHSIWILYVYCTMSKCLLIFNHNVTFNHNDKILEKINFKERRQDVFGSQFQRRCSSCWLVCCL